MRLLAHGGTLLAERARTGAWPSIHPALLEEKYGLEGNKKIFGVGVAGGSPFLILRELQANVGRLYPFTLLLDPGEAVWRRFSWNAAALLLAILQSAQDANSVASRLLSAPEQVTSSDVDAWFTETELPGPLDTDKLEVISLSECVAASTFLTESAAVAPVDLGIPCRPHLGQMQIAINSLPLCLRVGRGWLCGGGTAQGEAFGAAVVFDDERPKNTVDVSGLRLKGSLPISLLTSVAANPDLHSALDAIPPSWSWPSPVSDLADLRSVSVWLEKGTGENDLIRRLDHPVTGPFRELLLSAAEAVLKQGQGKLDASTTRIVIRYFGTNHKSLQDYVPRLDRKAVREAIDQDYKGEFPPFLGLPDDVRLELRLKEFTQTNQHIVARLIAILDGERWSPEEREQLRDAAWKRFATLDCPLSEWMPLIERQEWSDLVEYVQKECARRVKNRVGPWIDDYFAFGNDIAPETVLSLIRSDHINVVLEHALKNLSHSKPALEFLTVLHDAGLRQAISIENKQRVADAFAGVEPNVWGDFQTILQLMRGESASPISVLEKDALPLRSEILLLLKTSSSPPNLEALMACQGLLDEKTAKAIVSVRMETSRITDVWLRGLDLVVKKGWLDRDTYEANRLAVMEQQILSDQAWTMMPGDIEAKALGRWLHIHLFEAEAPNEVSIRLLAKVCGRWRLEDAFRASLSNTITAGLNSKSRPLFSGRFFLESNRETAVSLDPLFEAIPPELHDGMVEALFSDTNKPVLSLISDVIAGRTPGRAFNQAVLKFLLEGPSHEVKALVAKSDYGNNVRKMREAAAQRSAELSLSM